MFNWLKDTKEINDLKNERWNLKEKIDKLKMEKSILQDEKNGLQAERNAFSNALGRKVDVRNFRFNRNSNFNQNIIQVVYRFENNVTNLQNIPINSLKELLPIVEVEVEELVPIEENKEKEVKVDSLDSRFEILDL